MELMEHWEPLREFPTYAVSSYGRIQNLETERLLQLVKNQYGVVTVGLMRDGTQMRRSVPLLVATTFIPQINGRFDTPINLDGNRENNRISNLAWRPRWFAVKYNRQFTHRYPRTIFKPLLDPKTDLVSQNSWDCALQYGLLEEDLVVSIMNRTYVWPTYQEFVVLEE